MRNLRSSAPFPLAVRPSGWHKSICTADPRRHETPNLDWNAEFRNAEFRFSQLLYQGQTLVVHKLTESKFGIPKFGIPIEIRSLMSPGIGCITDDNQSEQDVLAQTSPRRVAPGSSASIRPKSCS